jgi:methyltransferase (TIGR00027 family)
MTCGCRAASWIEKRPAFKSGDWEAPLLLPRKMQVLFKIAPLRRLMTKILGPDGIYEWVIARTRYIDEVFERALASGFTQVLIVGAGFDTRAIRFKTAASSVKVLELDALPTQEAKLHQYRSRDIVVPSNVTFVALDFDRESLAEKLKEGGFRVGARTLVVAEGVFQYIKPEAAYDSLQTMRDLVGPGSWIVFDYAHASVLRGEGDSYGQARMVRGTNRVGESWQFGLDEADVAPLLAKYAFRLMDHKSPEALEDRYFRDKSGRVLGRINGTQSIAMAEKL